MNVLHQEMIELISEYLSLVDKIKFGICDKYLYECLQGELFRVSKIMSMMQGVNATVKKFNHIKISNNKVILITGEKILGYNYISLGLFINRYHTEQFPIRILDNAKSSTTCVECVSAAYPINNFIQQSDFDVNDELGLLWRIYDNMLLSNSSRLDLLEIFDT